MKKKTITLILCGIIFVTGVAFFSINYIIPIMIFSTISQSHIDGNVPSKEDIDMFLQRDLTKYFSSDDENINVKYKLLRDKPTQVGIAFPKYYAWIEVYSGDNLIKEGAIKVSAIDKKEFKVNEFLSKQTIIENEEILTTIFPSDVCKKIKLYVNNSEGMKINGF